MSGHTNHWWRAHHGISNDAKLQFLATRAGVKRCEIGWVWIILVDFASQNEPRGSTFGLSHAEIAFMAEIPEKSVASIINAMKERGMIDADGMLSSWSKRQPQRDRDDGDRTATERQRRRRLKLKLAGQSTEEDGVESHGDVTAMSRDGAVTGVTVTEVTEDHRDTLLQLTENASVNDASVTPCHAQRRGEESRGEYIKTRDASIAVESDDSPLSKKRKRQRTKPGWAEVEKALGERLPWFQKCFEKYPTQRCELDAMVAFERKVRDRELALLVYEKIKQFAGWCDRHPTQSVKYMQGWINAERWREDFSESADLIPRNGNPPSVTRMADRRRSEVVAGLKVVNEIRRAQ